MQEEGTIAPIFPAMNIRTGRNSIDESIIRCTVQCLAKYKVSQNDLAGIIVSTANILFGQIWELGPSWSDTDTASDTDESEDDSEASTKRRRVHWDYRTVFPSRRCIANYLEDATYLHLKMVADFLTHKGENVVSIGLDDTTKAAGHRSYDVKADHITVIGPDEKRRTMTTGYIENTTHSGKEAASAYSYKLESLALLADTSVEDIKASIDFWISDRAGDWHTPYHCSTNTDSG